MGAGRPRKTNELKAAQGTLEKSRVNERPLNYAPLTAVPSIPEDLDDEGAKYYGYVCTLLLSKRLLTPAYLFDIERAAFWYSQFKIAQRDIKNNTAVERSKGGWKQVGAYLSVAEKATKYLNEFDNKYGLNLVSGQKIEMPEIQDEPEY